MSRSASVETPTRRRRALSLSRLCTGSVANRIETTAMTTVYSRVASHQPAHAALNLDRITGELLADPGTLGLLFESLVVRDPRIYSRAQQGEVYCFRDNVGLEAGAIIERHDGAWIAVEAKLSPSAAAVDRAARSLLRLRSKVAALRWFTTPSRYEIDIVLDGVRHEYGMELDDDRVVQEWAYQYPKGRARLLFDRQGDDVRLGTAERSRSRAVLDLLRPNALLLSTAAAAGHPVLLPLHRWFQRNLRFAEADSRSARQVLTAKMLDDETQRETVLRMLRSADLGITDVHKKALDPAIQERLRRALPILMGTEEEAAEDDPPILKGLDELTGVNLVHRGSGTDIELDPAEESLGTLVWFGLVGPVIDSLRRGAVLLADELDASLHPDLVEHLVRLFQNPETNPKRAQLVFNSHDTTLLGSAVDDRLLGRDQIWFTQKLNDGRTQLYPLTRFDPRKQEAVGKRYLGGWYGAKPILAPGEFDSIADLGISENS